MKWLNWRLALATVAAVAIGAPALAAVYEKAGLIVPPSTHVKLGDDSHLRFGDGATRTDPAVYDVTVRWDGTDLDWLPNADDTIIKWGNGTLSFDQWFYGNSSSLYFSWDASASDLKFEDSVSLMFGTGSAAGPGAAGDVEIRWDGTDLDVLAAADDQVFKFGNGTNSWDVWLYGNTATEYVLWDASADDLIFQDNVSIKLGTGADVEVRWDATDLDILAAADDSVIKWGNGTNSFDQWFYGNTSSDYLLIDASANTISSEGDFQFVLNDFKRRVAAKTVDFTVPATESGTVYTTRGSTAGVNFTLPTSAAGLQYEFLQIADATMTVTCPADTCVIFNDDAADSVSFVTTAEMIGNSVRAYGDGTGWFLEIIRASDSVSVTTAS